MSYLIMHRASNFATPSTGRLFWKMDIYFLAGPDFQGQTLFEQRDADSDEVCGSFCRVV